MQKLFSKVSLWIGLTGLVVVGCGIAFIWPNFQHLAEQVRVIQTTQAAQTLSDTDLAEVIRLKQSSADLDDTIQTLQTAFVRINNPLPFVTHLEDLANQDQVTLELNIDQPAKNVSTIISPVITDIIITGNWTNALQFLHSIMLEPTYVVTKQLSIDGSNGATKITVHALTYWQK